MPKTEKRYTKKKMIKLTPDQNQNWDPKRIRALLDGQPIPDPSESNLLPLLKGLHQLLLEKFDAKPLMDLTTSEIALIKDIEEVIK